MSTVDQLSRAELALWNMICDAYDPDQDDLPQEVMARRGEDIHAYLRTMAPHYGVNLEAEPSQSAA